MRKQLILQG